MKNSQRTEVIPILFLFCEIRASEGVWRGERAREEEEEEEGESEMDTTLQQWAEDTVGW